MTPVSAIEIADQVRSGATTAETLVTRALTAADDLNPTLNAFLQVFHERALEQARAIDVRIASGDTDLPLAGVPIAIKDNICVAWGRTTCASRMLERYESPFSATAVERLVRAGAVIVGKANLDEFAMGSSTEHSAFGPTTNPWDTSRVPGGSSGGSAAAVAARITPIALGSDTGGSVRQPAAFTGIVGYKPTYGLVSRYGLVAFASSLDQIGTMSRTVADARRTASIIIGHDPRDATSATTPIDFEAASQADWPANGRLGVPKQARSGELHPAVTRAYRAAIDAATDAGFEIVDVDLPLLDDAIAAYYVVATAEASSNLARYDGVRYGFRAELDPTDGIDAMFTKSRTQGFGEEVKRRIMLGTHVLSSGYHDQYYTTALRARRLIHDTFANLLNPSDTDADTGCDAILTPATPTPAFRIGEKTADPLELYLQDLYTVAINLAGLPAITLPAGFTTEDDTPLPVGVQLIGRAFDDARLLTIAESLESAISLDETSPAVCVPG